MAVDFQIDGRRKFLRTVGLMLRLVSGTFALAMAFFIFTKIRDGLSFFQSMHFIAAFFIGGPALYTVGLVVHRKYKKPPKK